MRGSVAAERPDMARPRSIQLCSCSTGDGGVRRHRSTVTLDRDQADHLVGKDAGVLQGDVAAQGVGHDPDRGRPGLPHQLGDVVHEL